MLTLITDTDLDLTLEDPVRPGIAMSWRKQYEIWAWVINGERQATVCVAWVDSVPDSEDNLLILPRGFKAIAYTIWSSAPGAGAALIRALQQEIQNNPLCEGMYTLSPPTEMARKFHLKNGARVYRLNQTTVNYQYKHDLTASSEETQEEKTSI